MATPPQQKIDELKAQFPDRALFLIEAVNQPKDADGKPVGDGDEIAVFVMTGPTRDEYKKFADEIQKAKAHKSETDMMVAVREAIERAALAQIRWPTREECQRLFDNRPAMIDDFAKELHAAAGSNVELRSKKL